MVMSVILLLNMMVYFDNIQANSLTLTDVTINGTFTLDSQVTPAQGGTGISTYNKGDIIAASDSNTLTKSMLELITLQLYASVLKLLVLNGECFFHKDISDLVIQYIKRLANMLCHMYMLEMQQTLTILSLLSRVLDLANVGVLNGITQGDYLNGTIDTSGVTVTGSGTSFATDFIAGDVIYAGTEGRRIVSISGDSTMVLESAFATDLTGLSLQEWWSCSKDPLLYLCSW